MNIMAWHTVRKKDKKTRVKQITFLGYLLFFLKSGALCGRIKEKSLKE